MKQKIKMMGIRIRAFMYAVRSIPGAFRASYKRHFVAFMYVNAALDIARGVAVAMQDFQRAVTLAGISVGTPIDKSNPGETIVPLNDGYVEKMKKTFSK